MELARGTTEMGHDEAGSAPRPRGAASSRKSPGPHARSTQPRHGAELMEATRPFMRTSPRQEWWHLVSTFLVLAGFCALTLASTSWPLRLLGSLGMALTMVRAFILFHDVHHNALFRHSAPGRALLNLYGLILLTPPRIWRATHNHHHARTACTSGVQRGGFTLYSTDQWRRASAWERLLYRVEHHPLTVALGYVTVFLYSFGLRPFLTQPRAHVDSGLSLAAHVSLGAAVLWLGGLPVFLWAFLIPFTISSALGAYLFYVQHYFEGVVIPDAEHWSHEEAALRGSSYLKLGPILRWFTGNIGFHHVHHLNPRIPFYRLPAAMAAIPELQEPTTIHLSPRTIAATLRLKLWDPQRRTMVGYGDLAARDARQT